MPVTANEIRDWWHILATRDSHDTILTDDRFAAILAEDTGLPLEIDKVIGSLEALRDLRPEFFQRYDYGFAFDRSVYEAAMEANLQLRLIEALSELDAFFTGNGQSPPGRLDRIVVRRTWAMHAFAARPLTPPEMPGVPVRFVVAPLGFIESSSLAFRALLRDDPEPVLKALALIRVA